MKLSEWFPLTHDAVDIAVRREMGAYVLNQSERDARTVHYVGRDDKNVHRRLKEHVSDGKYTYFRITHVPTVKECYELECLLYHRYRPTLDNEIHPDRPKGTSYTCPAFLCLN